MDTVELARLGPASTAAMAWSSGSGCATATSCSGGVARSRIVRGVFGDGSGAASSGGPTLRESTGELDAAYVRTRSATLDLKLLLRTAWMNLVGKRRGALRPGRDPVT